MGNVCPVNGRERIFGFLCFLGRDDGVSVHICIGVVLLCDLRLDWKIGCCITTYYLLPNTTTTDAGMVAGSAVSWGGGFLSFLLSSFLAGLLMRRGK